MINRGLISVIIPAYNVEKYIDTTVESILAQTYKNLEIIIVNDGSTDDTASIIDAYAAQNPRVKAIHKENGGVTSARLRGVAEAAGEWVGFVDGDDYLDPDMYERLLTNAEVNNADISHCGYQMVFPNRTDYYYNTGVAFSQSKSMGLSDLMSGKIVEPGLWNKLYRKQLFAKINLEELVASGIRINEDLLMNYWLFKAADTAFFEDFCPYHYVVRKGSAANSGISEHKLWDPLRVIHIILEDVSDEVKPIVYQRLIRTLVEGATLDVKIAPQLIRSYCANARKELRQRLPEIIMRSKCGTKSMVMALWAGIWPASYRWVHIIYAKCKGTYDKYKLD